MRNIIVMLFLMLFSSIAFCANTAKLLPNPTEQKVFIECSVQSPIVAEVDVGSVGLSNNSITVTNVELLTRLDVEQQRITKQTFVNRSFLKKAGTARICYLNLYILNSRKLNTLVNTNRIRADGYKMNVII